VVDKQRMTGWGHCCIFWLQSVHGIVTVTAQRVVDKRTLPLVRLHAQGS